MICKYCNEETGLTGPRQSNHVAWCNNNPKRQERAAALHKARAAKKKEASSNQHIKAAREGRHIEVSDETRQKISSTSLGRKHTEATRLLLAKKQRAWLSQNPDKHPWKNNEKFVSVPCQVLKEKLRSAGLSFQEEYTPIDDRFFSVDIAFPDLRIAIEVNGEQHYNRDGSLRSYYKERHEAIVKAGWTVVELHYTSCYKEETLLNIQQMMRLKDPAGDL